VKARGHILLISQVYPPDPAAVGQYLADAAAALAARGWNLTVVTANRGYDDPAVRFAAREDQPGIAIRRLRWSSFGKRSIPVRLAGMLSFLGQALVRGLVARNLEAVLVSTSPPMAGAVAWIVATLRRVPLVYWVMDLNPDQAIAGGRARAGSLPVRLFEAANARVLRRAATCIVLDRFMAERLLGKGVPLRRLAVIPPWPLETLAGSLPPAENEFRRRHGLQGKFVVMYSGNHSLVHPLDTLLGAAHRLKHDARFIFALVGGGVAKAPFEAAVRTGELSNLLLLPYQPLNDLPASLSAADVQIVAMGDAMVGCVHPCKFYGALAVERPVLLIGPADCHVTEVFARSDCGWRVAHGDVDGLVALLQRLVLPTAAEELLAKAKAGRAALEAGLGRETLRARWADEVETAIGAAA
jgi:glycosyltransferase involved in cell wall biosynthesis